jgi:hypothetical protein
MKKSFILIPAVFIALIIYSCTKESGDIGYTDKNGGSESMYDGLSGGFTGTGSDPGTNTGDSTQVEPVDPGQITAAEWNDLVEWDFWINLGQNEEFNKAQENWEFFPLRRYSVLVKDNIADPLIDCEVTMKNLQGDVLWKTRTDNQGKAELWLDMNGGSSGQPTISVSYKGQVVTLVDPKVYEDGMNEVTMATKGTEELKADILFVVDATGSMGDEINYLKSELLDVIERVESLNSQLTLRIGSVFYRDEGDDYLTRVSPFSTLLNQTLTFIGNQNASGGGDYEEAVHTALNTAVTQLSWSDNARARLLFLVLDAPPHPTTSVVNDLNDIIRTTAEKGIKIIPISASGIDKDTEFLFRFFAAATNGTYVFITNDSGIGGEHIAATVGDYEVELLNDLIVRLIDKNTR